MESNFNAPVWKTNRSFLNQKRKMRTEILRSFSLDKRRFENIGLIDPIQGERFFKFKNIFTGETEYYVLEDNLKSS